MDVQTMQAKDVISARLASCYLQVGTQRYLLMNAKNLKSEVKKNKKEVPILGRTGVGHKTTGWEGTGSMTVYSVTNVFLNMVKQYKDSGEDLYFTIQVTNEDPTSAAGRQTVILKDCNIDSSVIASFDADGEWLEQDIDFTFDDYEVPEKFTELDGVEV